MQQRLYRFVASLILALSSVPLATGAAQEPPRAGAQVASPPSGGALLTSAVWSRPLTALDYVLADMQSSLAKQAAFWESTEKSGLWTSTDINRPSVRAFAFLSPTSERVEMGFDITAHRWAKPAPEVCRFFINTVIASVAGASTLERQHKIARNNVLSYSLPRTLAATTTDTARTTALDQLQEATTLRVLLFESATSRLITCERSALGDSIVIAEERDG